MTRREAPSAFRRTALSLVAAAVLLSSALPALATTDPAVTAAKAALQAIFTTRPDLQQVFRADWSAVPGAKTAGAMHTLEDWARRYGYKEYPSELAAYAPAPENPADDPVASDEPRALRPVRSAYVPVLAPGAKFDFSSVTADAVLVIDAASRNVLVSNNAHAVRPLASITKLMTASVALGRKLPMGKSWSLIADDEVGGARLRVATGTRLSIRGLFDAMLIGSANNAANAVARASALPKPAFVKAMNAKAKEFGLGLTTFVDPTGIEPANVSTASDVAALGFEAFALPEVARATTTAQTDIVLARETHRIKSTDGLLTDAHNGLYVMGGKTGYLEESKWNLVVKLRDARMKPLMVVVMGSDSQKDSFADAATLARWAWNNYRWTKRAAK